MNNRITPEKVDLLKEAKEGRYPIIVIGTNELGIHGAGFAKHAHHHWGLSSGFSFGQCKNMFCIPTKDWRIKTLPLNIIKFYLSRFIEYAKLKPNSIFYVTKIGCGLAGYKPEQIAPLFKNCITLDNVWLPQEFWDILNNHNQP